MSKCIKCGRQVDFMKSAFCLYLRCKEGKLSANIGSTATIQPDSVVLHVNGDRECGKQVNRIKQVISQAFGIREDFDDSFLYFL